MGSVELRLSLPGPFRGPFGAAGAVLLRVADVLLDRATSAASAWAASAWAASLALAFRMRKEGSRGSGAMPDFAHCAL